jgi:hypothetical protein
LVLYLGWCCSFKKAQLKFKMALLKFKFMLLMFKMLKFIVKLGVFNAYVVPIKNQDGVYYLQDGSGRFKKDMFQPLHLADEKAPEQLGLLGAWLGLALTLGTVGKGTGPQHPL